MAGLDESRGLYVVVGLGGGGASESAKERMVKRDAKSKAKDTKRQAKIVEKEKKRKDREERMAAAGLEDDELEDEDTEEEDSDSESDDEDDDDAHANHGRNRFGNAFQEVVRETGARVRMDSFEACVIEIRKEDLSGFLERLSMKAVVG
jgi:cell division control protein 45